MIIVIVTCALSAVIASLLTYYYLIWKVPSSKDIFLQSQTSVVELKSQTSDEFISYGTAVFINSDGTLVSNAHTVTYKQSEVYKEFTLFAIRFSFENDYRSVSLIKYDLKKDISFLMLIDTDDVNFKAMKTGNSERLSSGDKVYAIGNGLNHGISITQGLISLPRVNIDYENNLKSVIQCDLVINEGNSGGALLDERGKLIGVTTFRLRDYNGNIVYGIAFCIPINTVFDYFNQNIS